MCLFFCCCFCCFSWLVRSLESTARLPAHSETWCTYVNAHTHRERDEEIITSSVRDRTTTLAHVAIRYSQNVNMLTLNVLCCFRNLFFYFYFIRSSLIQFALFSLHFSFIFWLSFEAFYVYLTLNFLRIKWCVGFSSNSIVFLFRFLVDIPHICTSMHNFNVFVHVCVNVVNCSWSVCCLRDRNFYFSALIVVVRELTECVCVCLFLLLRARENI